MKNIILDPETVPGCVYLYDIQPEVLRDLLYPEAIGHKLCKAKELIAELYLEENTIRKDGKIYRDEERINKIYKAIKFNTALLEELK